MLKKLCFLTLLSSRLIASPLAMPDEFFVTERWVSLTTGFDIETNQYRVGTVFRKFWSLLPTYEFYDQKENLISVAKMRWMTFGAIFDVVEATTELPIGSVEEEVLTWYPTFRIYSPKGEKLAVAEMNFWGTTYEVSDPVTSKVMATLKRSFFRFKDDWKATIVDRPLFDAKGIDPRLFITLMAFQTDADNWKKTHDVNMEVPELESIPKSFCDDDDCDHEHC